MKKRITSLVLAFAMICSLLPYFSITAQALSADWSVSTQPVTSTTLPNAKNVYSGQTFYFNVASSDSLIKATIKVWKDGNSSAAQENKYEPGGTFYYHAFSKTLSSPGIYYYTYSHTFSNGITLLHEQPEKLYVFNTSVSVSSTDYIGTYDRISHSPSISVNGVSDYLVHYNYDTVIDGSNYQTKGGTGLPFGTVPGTTTAYYYVTVDGAAEGFGAGNSVSIHIKPSITTTAYTGKYDGSTHKATIKNNYNTLDTLYYSTSTPLTFNNYPSLGSTTPPSRTAAGTTTVYYIAVPNSNPTSNSCATGSTTITINKADTTVNATDYSGTFDNTIHYPSLNVSGPTNYTIFYSTSNALNSSNYSSSGATTKPTRTNAGQTIVYYYIKDNTGNYTDNSGSAVINIRPIVTATAYNGLSDGSTHSPIISATGGATLYYSSTSELTYNNYLSSGSTVLPSRTQAGTTTVYYIAVPDSNASSTTCVTGKTSITLVNPKSYTVSYNANGGTGAPASQTKTQGVALTLSSTKPTKSYKITYNANGGSVSPSSKQVDCTFKYWNTVANGSGKPYDSGATYDTDANVTLYAQWSDPVASTLPIPTLSSFTFDGWYTSAEGGTKVSNYTTITENMTVYAHWTQIPAFTYTVSYNANGGTGAPDPQINPSTISTVIPTKSYTITYNANNGSVSPSSKQVNCTFKNWNTNSNGSGKSYISGEQYIEGSSVILYAQWINPTVGTLATPMRSGYSFDGWYTSSSGGSQVTSSTTVSGNMTVYAHWTQIPVDDYTVSYNANGGTGAPSSQKKTAGVTLTLSSTKPTKIYTITYNVNNGSVSPSSKQVNCTFKNWNTSANGSGTSYNSGGQYKEDATVTLYAQWTNPTAGTLATPTRSGYSFEGWYTSSSGGIQVTSSTTITGNMTVYAHWTQIPAETYTVSYNANGGTGAPSSQKKTAGVTLTLSSTKPTKTYTITYNANNGSVSPSSKQVNCTFNNWNTAANGSGTSYNSGGQYKEDATVMLYAQWTNPTAGTLATPTRSGFTFNGWYTTASGGNEVTSSSMVTGNLTVYAHWIEVPSTPTALDKTEIFSFSNSEDHFGSSYYVSNNDFLKLTNYVNKLYENDADKAKTTINRIQEEKNENWGGSCYGMAVAAILDKSGAIGFNENFDPSAKTLYQVQSPSKNSAVKSAINYYYLAQFIPYLRTKNCKSYDKDNSDWKAGLKQLVSMSQEGKPMLFCYFFGGLFGTYGHAIVIIGYERAADGSHNIIAYDNRYPERDMKIKVDSNYSSCVINGYENAFAIEYIQDMSAFDVIDIDGSNNRYSSSISAADLEEPYIDHGTIYADADCAEITVPLNASLTIENAEGETLSVSNGMYAGTMDVVNRYMKVASTSTGEDNSSATFTVADSDYFMIESETDEISISVLNAEIYASASTDGANYVVISKKDGISALGSDFEYSLSLSVNNNICDMVSIAGHAENDVKLRLKGERVNATGVDTESGIVTVYSNIIDVDQYTYSKGYQSLVITKQDGGTPGEVDILGSSKENGIYDVKIGKAISKCEHNYTKNATPATCTEAGYSTYVCSKCGESYRADEVSALGHDFRNGVCTRCGKKQDSSDPHEDTCASKQFSDAPAYGNWAHEGIDYCIEHELMNGVGDGLFNPNGTVTRAQLVTILYRVADQPKVTTAGTFADVPSGKWYSDAIEWAAANKIVNGVGDGKFDPMGNITREQIATILYRYEGSPRVTGTLAAFPDSGNIHSYAVDALVWATGEGFINGIKSDGITNLAPQNNATRAQIASIIMRYLES